MQTGLCPVLTLHYKQLMLIMHSFPGHGFGNVPLIEPADLNSTFMQFTQFIWAANCSQNFIFFSITQNSHTVASCHFSNYLIGISTPIPDPPVLPAQRFYTATMSKHLHGLAPETSSERWTAGRAWRGTAEQMSCSHQRFPSRQNTPSV